MKLNVKTKLRLGTGFLFLSILTVGLLGFVYINRLSADTREILRENYHSLEYCNNMLELLDEYGKPSPDFDTNLQKQARNITEKGERDLTRNLEKMVVLLKQDEGNAALRRDTRRQLYALVKLNHKAMDEKNQTALQTANQATFLLGIIATLLLLVTFSFALSFPGYIANPIHTLTQGIKQIANRNYAQRIHFSSGDEFGELAGAFNTMAEKLNEYESSNLARIMFEKKRIETIISQMNDAIIGFDDQQRILFVNPVAEKLLGIHEKQVMNRAVADIAAKNELVQSVLAAGDDAEIKLHNGPAQGFYTRERVDVVNNGDTIGQVMVLKNVTAYKEKDFAKTNFIATVSHELKTPIASIKMSLKLLADARVGNLNAEQKELLRHIGDDTGRLLNITGELLNMAQVDTGNIQLNPESISPMNVIHYAAEALQVLAAQKQLTFNISGAPGLPPVYADFDKTAWVMVNLVANAVQYAPAGSAIELEAVLREGKVAFSVRDYGAGIDAAYRNKIFDRYFRVPGNAQHGTGLGLAIGREFIEAQGGSLRLDAVSGKGSKFVFELNTVNA